MCGKEATRKGFRKGAEASSSPAAPTNSTLLFLLPSPNSFLFIPEQQAGVASSSAALALESSCLGNRWEIEAAGVDFGQQRASPDAREGVAIVLPWNVRGLRRAGFRTPGGQNLRPCGSITWRWRNLRRPGSSIPMATDVLSTKDLGAGRQRLDRRVDALAIHANTLALAVFV